MEIIYGNDPETIMWVFFYFLFLLALHDSTKKEKVKEFILPEKQKPDGQNTDLPGGSSDVLNNDSNCKFVWHLIKFS